MAHKGFDKKINTSKALATRFGNSSASMSKHIKGFNMLKMYACFYDRYIFPT